MLRLIDVRLKSKFKPKDKRPDSDQLLCFKTISFIINTANQLNKKRTSYYKYIQYLLVSFY